MSDNAIQTRKNAAGGPKPGGCSPFAWLRRLALFRWIDANFNKLIVVLVALVTVLASIVAFLESWASSRYGADVRQSQALAMDALGYDMSSRQRENYDFYLYTTWNEWDWRRIRAEERDEALAERSRHVADMVLPLTPLLDESEPYFDGQYADFSAYHVDTNLITTTMLLEQRGFAIETASMWNGKADGYVTILTLLSVALFLFGLSTTIKGGLRYLFTAVGSFLVSVALLWALILTVIPVPTVPDVAIREYARGVGLSYLGDFEGAVEAFDAALQAYPRYGNASHERGKVYLRSGDYAAAVADFEQAVENGREDPSTYWEMGWAYYLMGDYESALAANYRALDLDPDLLPVVMNVGTALLADGQTEAAMEQYERGLAMVADPDASIPASWSHLYLRLTVVDLDTLIAALDGWTGFADEPDLSYVEDPAALRAAAEAARLRIKEGLVAIEAAGVFQMEPTGATLPSIAFARDVGLDGVLVGQGDTFARGTLAVVATLSYEDLPQGAVVSRRVMRQWADDPGAVENLPTMGADIPWNAGSEGAVQHVLWAPWPGDRGLRPGKYIVEYYVNGHLLQAGSFAIPDEDTLIFSPIVFATEYTSGGIPSDPADIFPAGVAEVYALINYSGVPEGNIAHAEWYRDGEYYYGQQTSAISGWGNHSFSISDVPAGTYRFDLSIEGQGEVLQSASFEVLAVGDYLQAIGGEPDNSLFYRNLGDAYAYASDYQAAGDSYEQAVELDSQCGKCYYRWWSVLYDQARYEEAIGKLERAIELRPKEYTYVSDLGRTYYLLGDDEKAAAAYREAVPANPASVYNRWGNAFFDLERYEEAAMKYQQSLELAPDDAVVHANLGGAYQELGEYDEAVAEFQEAVTVDPEYAWAYNRWGNVLYDQERYTEAAKKYLEAIAVAPADSLYHSNLGWAYFKLGWYEEAGAAFERAVELNPSASDCNMWGRALFELGQYLEAAEKHLWAIDLNPEEPLYHYNLGWDLYQLGETEEAIAAFEQAADLAAMQGDEDTLQDAEEALEGLR